RSLFSCLATSNHDFPEPITILLRQRGEFKREDRKTVLKRAPVRLSVAKHLLYLIENRRKADPSLRSGWHDRSFSVACPVYASAARTSRAMFSGAKKSGIGTVPARVPKMGRHGIAWESAPVD